MYTFRLELSKDQVPTNQNVIHTARRSDRFLSRLTMRIKALLDVTPVILRNKLFILPRYD
ncbi:hypothetical protein V1477_019878 [Vespula maculifrons]|uniref:Uncharacterized protein n=1 Tax=Vespula maculifrons TaxID=7453 RepID=A0ABD2AKC1_VESMC